MAKLIQINPASGDKEASLFSGTDEFSEVLETVPKGTILKVLGEGGGYYEVAYENKLPNVPQGGTLNTGCIIASPYAYMYIDIDRMNLLGKVNNGTVVAILDDSDPKMYKIEAFTTNGQYEGYIEPRYIMRDTISYEEAMQEGEDEE